MSDQKIKHLEFIQNNITRLSANSFLSMGWSITILAAVFTLSNKDSNKDYLLITYFTIFIFWLLSSYFLKLERDFRDLYNSVRVMNESNIDFSMDTSTYTNSIICAFFSQSLLIFYVPQIFSILAVKFLM